MRWFEFTKRNFKEIFRDSLSWVFLLGLPVVLFVVLEIMVNAIGADISVTSQFEIKHLTVSMFIFSFSFLTIFTGNILSKDREEKLLMRLKSTPMKSYDFVLGYTLSVVPFAIIQEIVVAITGVIFGLKLSLSIILLIITMLPISLIFIGFGILFGSLISSKGVGGIASIIPTASSLLGGMFFPLSIMTGSFKTFCYVFPFVNAIDLGQAIIGDSVYNLLLSIMICIIYVVVIYVSSILVFSIKLKKDNI